MFRGEVRRNEKTIAMFSVSTYWTIAPECGEARIISTLKNLGSDATSPLSREIKDQTDAYILDSILSSAGGLHNSESGLDDAFNLERIDSGLVGCN